MTARSLQEVGCCKVSTLPVMLLHDLHISSYKTGIEPWIQKMRPTSWSDQGRSCVLEEVINLSETYFPNQ